MSETPPTVYLSFTPRDQAAATRLANELRAAGVSVQLATEDGEPGVEHCDLFLPVISDNTQSQSTGGFRNEWQRGAQRAEAMADDTNFLLPVVIDNTANREAKVPPTFRGRSWLRQEVWAPTDALVAKVQSMLEKRASAREAEQAAQAEQAQAAALSWFRRWRRRLPPWVRRLRIVWVVTLIVLPTGAIMIGWRGQSTSTSDRTKENQESLADASAARRSPSASRRPPDTSRPDDGGADKRRPIAPSSADPLSAPRASFADADTSPRANWTDELPDQAVRPSVTGPSQFVPVDRMVGAAGQGNEIVNTPEEDSGAWTSRGASGGEANAQLTPPGSGGTAKPRTDSEWEDWEAQVLAQLAGNAGAAEEPLSDGVDARHASALQRAWLNYGAGQPESALRAMAGVPDALWVESRLFVGPVALLRAWMYRETGDDAAMRSAARVAVEIIALRAAAHPGDPAPEIAAAQAHALLGETGAAFGAMGRYDDATEGDSHAWDGQKAIVWAELQFNPDLIDRLIARFRGTMAEWNGLDSWLRWDPRLAAWRQRQP